MTELTPYHIVCPLGGSERAESILPVMMPLVRGSCCQVTLLQVSEESTGISPDQSYLARVRDGLRAHGILAGCAFRIGDPAEQILGFLREAQADLVAMTTQGRTGLSRMVRPSLMEQVLHQTEAPVLVCRTKQRVRPWRRILVPLDPAVQAESLIGDVAFLARLSGAVVELLEYVPPELPARYGSNELWRQAYGPGPSAITATLGETARRLTSLGVQVSCTRGWIFSTHGILDRAEEGRSDLICMTTHGRTGLPRLIFGSIAEEVVRHSPCPVFLRRIGCPRWGLSGPLPILDEAGRPIEKLPQPVPHHP